jgi:serine/threonine protein kinase
MSLPVEKLLASRPEAQPRALTLLRTCEEKEPGITRANSVGARREARPSPSQDRPWTARSLIGGSFIGPAAAKMTSALVPRAQRVCESTRFIRLDYTIGRALGAGCFASVRAGVCRRTGEQVAIKIFHRGDRYFNLDAVRAEINFHRSLESQHCVRLIAVYEDWESIYLVLEFAAGGHLASRIKTVKARFSENEAKTMMSHVLKGLDAMHSIGYGHRDVKFDNLLLMSDDPDAEQYLVVKLCDFGLSKALESNGSFTGICGTKQFWAPEMIEALANVKPSDPSSESLYAFDLKVDMWAAGVVLYTLLFGREPFKNEDDAVMYPNICRGATIPPNSTVSADAQDLVRRLLSLNRAARPSARQALQHPWLQVHVNGKTTRHDQCSSRSIVTEASLHHASVAA